MILKQIILLPENEMKIEFNNDISKNIIDIAELFKHVDIIIMWQMALLELVFQHNLPLKKQNMLLMNLI